MIGSRWLTSVRGARLAGLVAALGLIISAGWFDGMLEVRGGGSGGGRAPRIAEAAPLADVSRYRPAQTTTSTATPIIRLTPETATPEDGTPGLETPGVGTPDDSTSSPGGTPESSATARVPGGSGGSTPGAGPGAGRGEPPRDATTSARGTEGVAPIRDGTPAAPQGGEALGTETPHPFATPALADYGDLSSTAEAIRDAPYVRQVGPLGVSVDVDDPAAAVLWREQGSPNAGRSWADRIASNRPGPWGWIGLYPLLVILFFAAAWRVVAGVRGGGE